MRGKKSYELCGAQSRLNSILKKVGVQIFEFHDFEENPKIEDLDRGLLQLRVYHPDLILAIGGGSVLDMAKLLRFFYSYSGNKIGRVFEKIENLLPLIVIPTTAELAVRLRVLLCYIRIKLSILFRMKIYYLK